MRSAGALDVEGNDLDGIFGTAKSCRYAHSWGARSLADSSSDPAGLKSLSLDGVIESSRLPHSLPFQLTNLSVWVDIKYPLAAMDLLVASSRRTLTSLVLYDGQDPESFDWEEEIHALLGPLRPVAGHLRHFELTAPADSATTTNALAAFLKGARRLEYLVFLTSDFTKAFTAIDVLSATLKRLSLVVLNLDPKGFEALRRKISNFPRLEVLGMVGRWWHGEEVSCAAKVLLAEECAKRGIRLLLGELRLVSWTFEC